MKATLDQSTISPDWGLNPDPHRIGLDYSFKPGAVPLPGTRWAPELCQLASGWDEARFPDGASAEIKMDGIRCLYIGGGHCNLVTREGNDFVAAIQATHGLRSIEKQYAKPMVFDGEWVEPGGLNAAITSFRKGVRSLTGVLWVFDAIPLEQWLKNGITASHSARKARLMAMALRADRPGVGVLNAIPIADPREVAREARKLWKAGYEGLVVKDGNAPYERCRSTAWMKVKQPEALAHTEILA